MTTQRCTTTDSSLLVTSSQQEINGYPITFLTPVWKQVPASKVTAESSGPKATIMWELHLRTMVWMECQNYIGSIWKHYMYLLFLHCSRDSIFSNFHQCYFLQQSFHDRQKYICTYKKKYRDLLQIHKTFSKWNKRLMVDTWTCILKSQINKDG